MGVHGEGNVVQLFFNPAAGSYRGSTIDDLARAFRATGARIMLTPSVDAPPAIDPAATISASPVEMAPCAMWPRRW
jgi:hypothetical protein